MNKYYVACFLVISFVVSSCTLHRKAHRKKDKTVKIDSTLNKHVSDTLIGINDTKKLIPNRNDSIIYPNTITDNHLIDTLTSVWNKRMIYNTFSGKAKIHFEGREESQEFTANFRIRKDSVIWITITAMGGMVQAARILVTNDSFIMVNYLQKEVTKLPLSQAAKVLPSKVDFFSLQNLIIGEPLRNGKITDAKVLNATSWMIQVEDTSYIQNITYNRTDTTMSNGQMTTRNPIGPKAIMQYETYEISDQRKISKGRVMNIQNGIDTMSLDVKFLNANFDLPLEFPFSIPASYKIK